MREKTKYPKVALNAPAIRNRRASDLVRFTSHQSELYARVAVSALDVSNSLASSEERTIE